MIGWRIANEGRLLTCEENRYGKRNIECKYSYTLRAE